MSTDYTSWTNDQLVARVTSLERQLREANANANANNSANANVKANGKSKRHAQSERPAPREIDPSRYSTRFVALKIAYFGQAYNGFEHHVGNITPLPTVEEEIWKALVKTKLIFKSADEPVSWEGCQYSKSGRTDKGVSAFGQVIGIRVRSARPLELENAQLSEPEDESEREPFRDVADELAYPRILNRVLPKDIRVLSWCPSIPEDFSARFSCRMRKYKYFFTQPARLPIPGSQGLFQHGLGGIEREGWLDIDRMSAAASKFLGNHDFRNFCKLDPARQITNFERRIFVSSIEKVPESSVGLPHLTLPGASPTGLVAPHNRPGLYCFNVWGSAFLWNQVRSMVAILFLIGQGLEDPSVIEQLLDVAKCSRKPLYDIADDRALVLWDCIFPADDATPEIDGLDWVYPDAQSEKQGTREAKDARFGFAGTNDVLWTNWYQRKIDETLAAQLLEAVSQQPGLSERLKHSSREAETSTVPRAAESARVIDGSGSVLRKGRYVPLLQRPRQEDIEVLNKRWASRQGQGQTEVHALVEE